MSDACRRRDACRLCGSAHLEPALHLPPTPPANAFVAEDDRGGQEPVFPLDLYFCTDCAHLQLLDIVDPALLFENYVYVSGTSPQFVKHFDDYAAEIMATYRHAADASPLAVDIGSNDGTLLKAFARAGCRIVGIDPARDIAAAAAAEGVPTEVGFFDATWGARLRADHGPADYVTANNVYAHIDDLSGVTDGVRALLSPSGVFVFEVSYLADVLEKTLFDTIYHEHLSYHALAPLIGFFERHGLELIGAQRIGTHGGSLRGVVQPAGGPRDRDAAAIETLLVGEREQGLGELSTYLAFDRQIDDIGTKLRALLDAELGCGRKVAGFGAPAKLTTLMYRFALGPEHIDYIVDDSPWKQGLYTPGRHIEVVSAAALAERKPDVLVIFAWNFADAIIAKQQAFAAAGGRFIVPLPEPVLI